MRRDTGANKQPHRMTAAEKAMREKKRAAASAKGDENAKRDSARKAASSMSAAEKAKARDERAKKLREVDKRRAKIVRDRAARKG